MRKAAARRTLSWAGTTALALVAGVAARATGTIDTTGATVESGAAPTQGTVTIDPDAPTGPMPSLPTPWALGADPSYTGSLPVAGSTGDGSGGAFAASSDATLAGGTYEFTSYAVTSDAVVTYSSAVTILVQGDVDIEGSVLTTAASATIEIRAGGHLYHLGENRFTTNRRIEAAGAGAGVTLEAAGQVRIGDPAVVDSFARVRSGSADVTVVSRGNDLLLRAGSVEADSGTATAQAGAEFEASSSGFIWGAGGVVVQAFNGDLYFLSSSYAAADSGDILLEGTFGCGLSGNSYLSSATGDVTVRCIQGSVDFDNSRSSTSGSGSILAEALLGVRLRNNSYLSSTAGPCTLLAHGGDVSLDPLSSGGSGSYVSTSGGAITARASAAVVLGEDGQFSTNGAVSLGAVSGSIVLEGISSYSSVFGGGGVDLRAGAGISFSGSDEHRVEGSTVSLAAGAGGVSGLFDRIRAQADTVAITSSGPVNLDGNLQSKGALRVSSLGADVGIAGHSVTTDDALAGDSASVLVETFLATGSIDVSGSQVRSGTATGKSGDVTVRVLAGGTPAAIQSYLLPKKIAAKVGSSDGSRDRLVASGFFDLGPDLVDLGGPTVVGVGGLSFSFDGLDPDAKGRKFTHAEEGLALLVTPAKSGSSRAKFRLTASGSGLAAGVDPEGDLDLSFDNGAITGTGTVTLEGGKYVLGRKRGALKSPDLWLSRAKGTLKGGDMDALKMSLGLATDGGTPAEAPDVAVGFGDAWTASVPGSSFTATGDVLKGAAGGVSVILDYAREQITVSARGVSLGQFTEGAQGVTVTVTVGGETRSVRVRCVRKGTKLSY